MSVSNVLCGPSLHRFAMLSHISEREFVVSEITLKIDGMHCGACIRRVTQTLQRVPGTEVEEVRIGAARVKSGDASAIVAALAKAGYPAHAE